MKKIILASTSAGRKTLLQQIGLPFEVEGSNIEEKLNPRLKPRGNAENLSLQKALAVAEKYKRNQSIREQKKNNDNDNVIIIAADTFMVFNDEILGKPADKKAAKKMLEKLSGNSHSVITGFTIIDSGTGKTVTKSVETKVFFRKLSQKEIDQYIWTKEPFNKAGAYAMQGKGGMFIEKIVGEPFNVEGLPIQSLVEELKKFHVDIFKH